MPLTTCIFISSEVSLLTYWLGDVPNISVIERAPHDVETITGGIPAKDVSKGPQHRVLAKVVKVETSKNKQKNFHVLVRCRWTSIEQRGKKSAASLSSLRKPKGDASMSDFKYETSL